MSELKIFIASASESLDIAKKIKLNLKEMKKLDKTLLWTDDQVFLPQEYFIQSIERIISESDIGIFILGPDDDITIRGQEMKIARDNVIFELGFCVGKLGLERTLIVEPEEPKFRILTDLDGITPIKYSTIKDIDNEIKSVCEKIIKHLEKLTPLPRPLKNVRPLNGPLPKWENIKAYCASHHLITDTSRLLSIYEGETYVEMGSYELPYKEIQTWKMCNGVLEPPTKIEKNEEDFLLQYKSMSHKLFQVQAYAQLISWGRIRDDKTLIRLNNEPKYCKDVFTFNISKAKYSDQVQSNFVLHWPTKEDDWHGEHGLADPFFKEDAYSSLRVMLSSISSNYEPKKLPPLEGKNSKYLANTIGISCILFYKTKEGHWVPVIRKREEEENPAIYERGWHATTSFALTYDANTYRKAETLNDLVESPLRKAIYDKSSIMENEIGELRLLALCREFMRGGKPQLFYAGKCPKLSKENIIKKFEEKKWNNILHVENSEEIDMALYDPGKRDGYTVEFAANWHYCRKLYIDTLK